MPQAQQQGLHLLAGEGVERPERLVQQQQLRIRGQRAGNPDTLPLAAGKLPDIAFFRAFQPHFFQHRPRGFQPLFTMDARKLQPKRHVFLHVAPGKQAFILEDHAALGAGALHLFAFQLNGAMLIRDKPGDEIQQRGFSAPGRAQHHQQLTAVQRQVDVL